MDWAYNESTYLLNIIRLIRIILRIIRIIRIILRIILYRVEVRGVYGAGLPGGEDRITQYSLYDIPCDAMLCYAILCYAILYYAMLCYTILYYNYFNLL